MRSIEDKVVKVKASKERCLSKSVASRAGTTKPIAAKCTELNAAEAEGEDVDYVEL